MRPNLKATPDTQWLWHQFGVAKCKGIPGVEDGTLVAPVTVECAWFVPWWFRLVTRVLLRSRWERPSVDHIIARRQAIMEAEKQPEGP